MWNPFLIWKVWQRDQIERLMSETWPLHWPTMLRIPQRQPWSISKDGNPYLSKTTNLIRYETWTQSFENIQKHVSVSNFKSHKIIQTNKRRLQKRPKIVEIAGTYLKLYRDEGWMVELAVKRAIHSGEPQQNTTVAAIYKQRKKLDLKGRDRRR